MSDFISSERVDDFVAVTTFHADVCTDKSDLSALISTCSQLIMAKVHPVRSTRLKQLFCRTPPLNPSQNSIIVTGNQGYIRQSMQ